MFFIIKIKKYYFNILKKKLKKTIFIVIPKTYTRGSE